jgi:hypothetical protein
VIVRAGDEELRRGVKDGGVALEGKFLCWIEVSAEDFVPNTR